MFNKILILVLVLILGVACYLQSSYLNDASSILLSKLATVKQVYEQGDFETALANFELFEEEWHRHEKLFNTLLEHNMVDVLFIEIESIHAWLLSKNDHDLPAAFSKLEYFLTQVPKQDALSLENIL